jgi:predicted TIM-barrel fold metal-dependent hydrolase
MRSYNDWILGLPGRGADRIVGLPMLPVDDGIDVCIAELERCLRAQAGMFVRFPARPTARTDPLYARRPKPRPLTFHRTFGGKPNEADWDELVNQNVTTAGTVYRFFSAVKPFTYMVLGGVFTKHPDLRFVAAEVNFGWLPFWAQTMEQNVDVRSELADDTIGSVLRPTEHLGRNLFVTVLDDHVGFGLVREHPWLADCAMYSTDYPHSVTLWPNSREHVTRSRQSRSRCRQILAGSAAASTASDDVRIRPHRAAIVGAYTDSPKERCVDARLLRRYQAGPTPGCASTTSTASHATASATPCRPPSSRTLASRRRFSRPPGGGARRTIVGAAALAVAWSRRHGGLLPSTPAASSAWHRSSPPDVVEFQYQTPYGYRPHRSSSRHGAARHRLDVPREHRPRRHRMARVRAAQAGDDVNRHDGR